MLPSKAEVLSRPVETLFEGTLLMKSLESGDGDSWKFKGIASDESPDVQGDEILKKSLDLSYAQQRGYVNWDHSRKPEDQVGYLTHVEILSGERLAELQKSMSLPIADTATVYLEGELYKYVKRAQAVHDLLKSAMDAGNVKGLGLSLDGVMARDRDSGDVVKAFVRGVALCTVPAHPKTMCMLMKSLQSYSVGDLDGVTAKDVAGSVGTLGKSEREFNADEAILWVLQRRPKWTYEFATKVVNYTIANIKR